ncbi:MAG: hydantoinase B/oxoprolinase family protein [Solirubrobacteraceae bacterium]
MSLDPIELQVLTGALRAACEEMGAVLIRSAHSPNIKERRDCSTALFDAQGQMVMQAEHIPVHLGSMPAAVAAVLGEDHSEGRSWVLNDPFAGGTHLPDITLISPVLVGGPADDDHSANGERRDRANGVGGGVGSGEADDGRQLIGFAVSRAHHADVGGRVPGSMPADSRTLAEEGVVISPRPATPEEIERLVARMRQPQERRADLRAQLAANRIGAQRLCELAERVGVARLHEGLDAVLDYAERRTRACVAALPDGVHVAEDVLEAIEGDLVLRLRATVEGERLLLDFAGSAPQHAGNLNCPLAVTHSACYFAVRVLTDPDIPPSAGAYRPVEIRVTEGCLLNALRSGAQGGRDGDSPEAGEAPAVAAGNVETSSRVADLVLGAFGRALGQGTMNNLTLGDERFSYYETLGGGQGACPDADGPSGVHVAMSNTLNTPVEALERELPLRVTRYALRRGSGGAGAHRGGDGVVREIEALREMTFSLITERRRHPPPGAHGGRPGARGRNMLIDGDAPPADTRPTDTGPGPAIRSRPSERNPTLQPDSHELPGKVTGVLRPGQRLRIETPGGGGDGPPETASR